VGWWLTHGELPTACRDDRRSDRGLATRVAECARPALGRSTVGSPLHTVHGLGRTGAPERRARTSAVARARRATAGRRGEGGGKGEPWGRASRGAGRARRRRAAGAAVRHRRVAPVPRRRRSPRGGRAAAATPSTDRVRGRAQPGGRRPPG